MADRVSPTPVHVRHDLGRTVALIVWAVALVTVAVTRPVTVAAVLAALGVGGLVWVLCWWPAVAVDDDAVIIRNPLRVVRIGWAALDEASFDWALRLQAGDVVCRAAAAPGPASMGVLYDRLYTDGGVLERRLVVDSGRNVPPALLLVRQRWAARAAASAHDVVVSRPWPAIAVLAASLTAIVVALAAS